MGAVIRLKAYDAWLVESRTAVEVPASQVAKLIRDLQTYQSEQRRVL